MARARHTPSTTGTSSHSLSTANYCTSLSTAIRSVPPYAQYRHTLSTAIRSVLHIAQYRHTLSTVHRSTAIRSVLHIAQYRHTLSAVHRSVPHITQYKTFRSLIAPRANGHRRGRQADSAIRHISTRHRVGR
eukprot:3132607-Rhodomonas_salina.3